MKISLLTDGIYPYIMGGMQKHSYFLAKHLAQEGVYVDLYHYRNEGAGKSGNPFSLKEMKFLNIIEVEYPLSKKFPGHYLYERYLYSKNVLKEIFNRELPDFIYAKGFSGWALLKNKQKLQKEIPIGVNFHGYEMFQQWPDFKTGIKLQILKLPVKYNVSKADYVFSYGGKVSDIIERINSNSKIVEIPTGIGASWLASDISKKESTGKRRFIFVGRAERRKGIVEINQFLSATQDKNFEFHFVGPITEDEKIKKPNVIYHGTIREQDKLQKILDEMDVLVCPSYSEGMPNVIMEGMARGLAVIATDVGAVNQMVDAENGWLIEKSDINAGISSAIVNALKLSDAELHKKKKISIEKIEQNFTWEKVIDQTIKKIRACTIS
ncbi:glycosyltransferase family 4 protein [Zunongwangia sp. F260]|uniref:Glycosyltransferase family 4 protein n=1 Tax=Autumnicola lenta TaxID=3075593 RepID=A0ABU3CM96_9FLAO|nr:glycosyltransferase family 4 protein [Zunongwangia sp. F260]MDT0647441.1 glycosyltransferase family 4 protein [Zunongwangia sp. F260]